MSCAERKFYTERVYQRNKWAVEANINPDDIEIGLFNKLKLYNQKIFYEKQLHRFKKYLKTKKLFGGF